MPVKQRGWVDKISLPVLRFFFFFFLTRPGIWRNNSSRCVQVILSSADTAPNIRSRTSSHFQTSLDFFTMELEDDSSPIQMATPRDNVRPQPLSATETAPAFTSHPPAGKGLWPLQRVGVLCTQYRNAATRGRHPKVSIKKERRNRKILFGVFHSFLSLSNKIAKAPLMKTQSGFPEVLE